MAVNLIDSNDISVQQTGSNIQLNVSNNIKNSQVYSTTETKVGTWIDGKPLYRKVVIIDSINSSTNGIDISAQTSNLKEFVNITGMVANKSGGYKPTNSIYVSSSGIDAQYTFQVYAVNNSVISVVYGNWWKTNFKKAYVILEYTKTTD